MREQKDKRSVASYYKDVAYSLVFAPQFSYHQNIATYYGAFVKKGDPGCEDQLWVSDNGTEPSLER